MTIQLYVFLSVSVLMSALAQITLKAGMSSVAVQNAIATGPSTRIVLEIARNPGIVTGLALYGFSVMVWLSVLAKIEVSRAYPFVGLGFLVTMIFGCMVLGETFNLMKAFGTLLVALGVYLVAQA